MAAISNFLTHKLFDHVLRAQTYTPPSSIYVALYTSNPGDDDSGTEVSGDGYERVTATFSAASGRKTSNSADVEFPEATGSWGTITHIGLRTASTAGDLLYYGALTSPVTIGEGQQLIFKTGNIELEQL